MKKILFTSLLIALIILSACGNDTTDQNTLKVGASPLPHGEILEQIKEDLSEEGINLEIVEFTDYVKPNLSLSEGELDANFFQHSPYLEDFNKNNDTDLISLGSIHLEPLGVYSNNIENIDDIEEGNSIAIPSDPTNGGRALLLLENNGLIKLDENAGLLATEEDIIENPKNLEFKPLEAAQIPRSLNDVDLAVINGNYALEANLTPTEDAIILEKEDSPYGNILAIRNGDEDRKDLKLLIEALQSEKVKNFIENNYEGGIIPTF
ncbi:MetQ/NlpA family ABC transporter substrate-binding protein [Clostridium sp. D2Q-14]|uniref:MetQ/NlpA family ABC transporter substrate-binding protein n=1 Tax=Anaeromonas gelatinilytica TaxID=2683194 RepID=UPI00193B28D7|nr:MetQ/NlpA family ABC transporter substrate-binding protein [Anaeromonas gelatinilytica]MBS4534829.1 MetQ/NlpA family ABC transporter substrate-binding protein [Anaeromonas gelatinilytica]